MTSRRVARTIGSMMIDVVAYGTGTAAAIPGVRVAGKTGTAELGVDQAPHSWFIGFAPAEDGATPSIAIAVLVESGGSGSGRAAPIAGRVMAEYLRLAGQG